VIKGDELNLSPSKFTVIRPSALLAMPVLIVRLGLTHSVSVIRCLVRGTREFMTMFGMTLCTLVELVVHVEEALR
jgi:hypothetical protein